MQALTLGLFLLGPAWADWAGFAGYSALAELSVEPEYLSLNLRMTADGLPHLAELAGVPADAANPDAIARRILQIQDGQGNLLKNTELRSVRETIRAQDGSAVEFYDATLRIPLDRLPEKLVLVPPAGVRNEIGVVVLHRGVPLGDLATLSQAILIHLDRDDPWQSRLDDPNLVRRHAQPRSFLYVEPYEVRHEILIRLADLQHWLQVPLKDSNWVSDAEKAVLTNAIGQLVKERTRLKGDGVLFAPELDQVEFVHFTRSGVQPLETGPLDTKAALVGIVLVYLTEKPVDSVALTWDLFPDGSGAWPVTVIDGQESFESYVTPAKADFDWSRDDTFNDEPDRRSNHAGTEIPAALPELEIQPPKEPTSRFTTLAALILPVTAWYLWLLNPHRRYGGLALALSMGIGAFMGLYPMLAQTQGERGNGFEESQVRQLLPPLLHNAYRAFQLRSEEAVYDRLALSLDGALLEDTYLQQRRAAQRQAKGLGGLGKVDRIEIQQADMEKGEDPRAYRISAEWIAHGTVSHWGHSHPRHNRYHAKLTLQAGADRHLKIIAMEFLDGHTLGSGSSS